MAQAKRRKFDVMTFLAGIGVGRTIAVYAPGKIVFAQGDPANAIFYIQSGKVKLSVISGAGKEAVIAILGSDAFFGEGCLAHQPVRIVTATAMSQCSIMRLEQATVVEYMRRESLFAERLLSYMLTRARRIEEDLVDQLFNSSEKRLARALLLLASVGEDGKPGMVMEKVSQETLAEIVGTTRSRVSFFMNKFRKLGFVDYDAGDGLIQVHQSLVDVVLRDETNR